MLRDLTSKLKFTSLGFPVAVSADGSSTAVDNEGKGSCAHGLHVGTFAFDGSNKLVITVQESDTNVDGDFVNVPAYGATEEVAGVAVAKTLDAAATDDESLYIFQYKGNKRYSRLHWVETGTVSVIMSNFAIQGHLNAMPVALPNP